MSHSPEPWESNSMRIVASADDRDRQGTYVHFITACGDLVVANRMTEADADRAAACVNACAGATTEMLTRVKSCCINDNGRTLGLILNPTDLDLRAMREMLKESDNG